MIEQSTPITVSTLTFAIKNQLESRFANLAIEGEISNCKLHSSGHLYFDLKDDGAKISAVMFRCDLKQLPKEGDHVIVHGSLSVYPPHGKYQFLVKKLERKGIGELLYKLELLKKTLQARGWFDKALKKNLPKFPKKIGVVTSPTGAVIRDIIHVLSRRYAGFHLILHPVRVQGTEAAGEIACAIQDFNKYELVDVLIVARGGGSIEDLWPFNEEIVAKAIFESKIPIISAVGHETDVTIADFVADVRAPTPSAAAEIVSSEKESALTFLSKVQKGICHSLLHLAHRYRTHLNGLSRHPFFSDGAAFTSIPAQKLDEIKSKLDEKIRQETLKRKYLLLARKKQALALSPTTQIDHMQQKLAAMEKRIDESYKSFLALHHQKMKEVASRFIALDPKNVLKRGYCILFALNKSSVIVSAKELAPGEKIKAQFSDGNATLMVES